MEAPKDMDPNVRRSLEMLEAELSARQATTDAEELSRVEASSGGSSVIDRTVRSAAAGIARAGFETYDFVFGEPDHADKTDFRRSVEAQDRALDRQSGGYGMVSGVSQFVTGLVGAGKLTAPIKTAQTLRNSGKAGRLAYEVGRGAIAGAIVLDPHEERLSNLIQSYPALENPLTDYLAADLTDTSAEGRLKNALEGIGLDLAVVGIDLAGDQLHQCRLACAVASQQPDPLAPLDLQVDLVDQRFASVGELEATQAEQGHRFRPRFAPREPRGATVTCSCRVGWSVVPGCSPATRGIGPSR